MGVDGRAQRHWPKPVDQTRCKHIDANGHRCELFRLDARKRLEWEGELGHRLTPNMCLVHAVRSTGNRITWNEFIAPLCRAKAKSTGQLCKKRCMRNPEGGHFPVCSLHGAKGALLGRNNRKKPGDPMERKRAKDAQKRIWRRERWKANRAKEWEAMAIDPVSCQSPLEEREAQRRKPLRPLY
jgi:hypothetical protein